MNDHADKYDDLEIAIHRRAGEPTWSVDLRYDAAGSDTDVRIRADIEPFDLQALRTLELRSPEYGAALRDALLSTPSLRRDVARAVAASEASGRALRVRIVTPVDDEELRALRWELLMLPDRTHAIGLDDQVVVSRYIDSQDLRPVSVRTKGDVRAVVVVAGTGQDRFQVEGKQLDPVDVEREVILATSALQRCTIKLLARPGEASIENIREAMIEGADLLYIVCHGVLGEDGPRLLLHEGGRSRFVRGQSLVDAVGSLASPPRLVVLASCQSAGAGVSVDHGAMAALGPALAGSGVPAVVAMQGDVSQRMVATFMPAFFAELSRHGRIDVAMAAARRQAFFDGRHDDWWGPVLFMRLRSGRLWYTNGAADGDEFSKWPALVTSIREGKCVAVCGMGMTDSLIGSRKEIAHSWARTYSYPMVAAGRQDLPQVAQYVSVTQDDEFIRAQLGVHLMAELKRRYGDSVTDIERQTRVDGMLRQVWREQRCHVPGEPHAVLASLPFSFYVNAHPSGLLVEALRKVGRKPEAVVFRWKDDLVEPDDAPALDAPSFAPSWEDSYVPSPDRPLVVQMFGNLLVPESLILTEDDYFDYLIGLTRNLDRLPASVRRALARNPLMFVGFGVQDWDFRILSRTIQTLPGAELKKSKRTNVSAQIGPDELEARDPDAARDYLAQYLSGADINVFWGSVDDFCTQLAVAWRMSTGG